jgi:hypothetical protein
MNTKKTFFLVIGIAIAVIIFISLMLSGWKIVTANINLGPLSFELKKPSTDTPEITTVETIPPAPPADQPVMINHTPVILRLAERKENKNGELIIYKDIYFMDSGGDATTVVYKLISTTIENFKVNDDTILASSDEQKYEASVTGTWECGTKYHNYLVVLEARILDKAGNLSEPVSITFSCQ